jgi:hypothetical protein
MFLCVNTLHFAHKDLNYPIPLPYYYLMLPSPILLVSLPLQFHF